MSDDLMPQPLVLNSDLGPKAVRDLHAALLGQRGAPLRVDASEVAQIGGGCLQLLLSAQQTWAADGLPFELVSPSTSLADALAFTGLSEAFGIDTGATA